MLRALLALALVLAPEVAAAQLDPVIVEAESGAVGSQFTIATDATATTYAAIQSTVGGFNPTTSARVIGFAVSFPHAGVWELYARVFVGPATFNDDSMFYANGLGAKNPAADADWILANQLAGNVGYTNPTDRVTGGGLAASGVWKWVKLSAFDGGEPPVNFTVAAPGLHVFSVAGREDGLLLDKFAFGPQGVFFTVFDLDNGLPGSTEPPPPPFTPTGPPLATGKAKFLGGVSSPPQNLHFTAYFNQVTPENGGKWGSVEATKDAMTWGDLDTAYALARNNGFPFRLHTLIWGNQQPNWIAALPPAQQRVEIEQWFAALADRYPDIDFIDVVNEPLHDPPDDPADGGYIEALGGRGTTGWDWVIESFKLARRYFPRAKLGINEFSVTNTTADMIRYIEIVELLKKDGLIDTVGVQGHAFSTRPNIPMSTHIENLDRLAATGLPIYVTELDIDGPTDAIQLADYQRIFPVFWEHPAVRGITLWGYRPGHWRTAQGAFIALDNGHERPALVWLRDYVRASNPGPWATLQPTAKALSIGESTSFTCQLFGGDALAIEWRFNGQPIAGNPTATSATLSLAHVTTAAAGTYTCVVSHAQGTTTSVPATLVVNATAISRSAPIVDGTLKGSLHLLKPEAVVLSEGSVIDGDLLVPGTPDVVLKGSVTYLGTIDGSGNPSPANYAVTLRPGASLAHVVRATDPVVIPPVPAPPAPTGARDVVVSNPGDPIGDFATVRNLTLKSNAGAIAVPAGTYGTLLARNASSFTLGVAGAREPAVYNLDSLTLVEGGTLDVAGPVILNVRGAVTIAGDAGSSAEPAWLRINIASGGLTVSGAALHGYVVSPAAAVTVRNDGRITGGATAERLVIKRGGVLEQP